MIEELFKQSVKERRYVQNSSPHTIAFYEQSFKTCHRRHWPFVYRYLARSKSENSPVLSFF